MNGLKKISLLPDDLTKIVERASSLTERLRGDFLFDDTSPRDENTLDSRLAKWCQVIGNGDKQKFIARLAVDGLNLQSARDLLGTVHLANSSHLLPHWAYVLQEVCQINDIPIIDRCFDVHIPIPFEDLLLPFVLYGRRKLIERVGDAYELLSEESQIILERSLLSDLSKTGAAALLLKFKVFCAWQQPELLFGLSPSVPEKVNTLYYQLFVKEMLNGKLSQFFVEYSALARLWALLTDYWVDSESEFINRLKSDLPILNSVFCPNSSLGLVSRIEPNLSDPHRCRRNVMQLEFDSGTKLIYKPRNLSLDIAFNALLQWLNKGQFSLKMKVLKVIERSTYGWVEFVEHLPCADQQMADRYYQRTGILLCLLYILKGADFHYENVIAHGEYPVPIDLEMLFCSQLPKLSDNLNILTLGSREVSNSVLCIGFLPAWDVTPDGQPIDLSALGGGVLNEQQVIRQECWRNINTDNVELTYEERTIMPSQSTNLILVDGKVLSPNDYLDRITFGFQYMYEFLMEHKDDIFADSSLILFKGQSTRFVYRKTRFYYELLYASLDPNCLKEGIDRSIQLDALSRALIISDEMRHQWPLLVSEIEAMERMDIPEFHTVTDKNDLIFENGSTIPSFFNLITYDEVVKNLHGLNYKDLRNQIIYIQSALYTRIVQPDGISSSTVYKPSLATPLLDTNEMIIEASKIGKLLEERAIREKDSAIWLALNYKWRTQRYKLQPIGHDLYSGMSGVALFLAALSKATGEGQYRELSRAAFRSTHYALRDTVYSPAILRDIGIGGAIGIGSIVYALTKGFQYLQDDWLLEDATHFGKLITLERINSDNDLDVVSGSAGAILGLLALYRITKDANILERAIACGQHLLSKRVSSIAGPRAWVTLDGNILTGFSHGASGIAYALIKLYEASQDYSFCKAGEEAFAYERNVFVTDASNWPDFRSESDEVQHLKFMVSWCHGALGIGLARLGVMTLITDPNLYKEIDIALDTTRNFGISALDHVCCGNMGQVELLLSASLHLYPELRKTALQLASKIVHAAQLDGYGLFDKLPRGIYNPSFFRGLSGIGYELLRVTHPAQFPSVMLWE